MLVKIIINITIFFILSTLLYTKGEYDSSHIRKTSDYVFLLDTLKHYELLNNSMRWDKLLYTKYNYNSELLKSEELNFILDSVNLKHINKNRNILQYNENKLLSEDLYQEYIITDTSEYWLNKLKTLYYYDENLNLIEEVTQEFKIVGTFQYWVNKEKYNYLYDATGLMIEKTYYQKDNYSDNWVGINKYNYTYDSQQRLIEELELHYTNKIWENFQKKINIFDDVENSLETRELHWNSNTEKWRILGYRFKYFYNKHNDMIQHWSSKRINDSTWDEFILNQVYEYVYNNKELKILSVRSYYLNSSYVNIDSTFFYYDDNDNLIEKKYLYWNDTNWIYTYNYKYVYDESNNLTNYTLYVLPTTLQKTTEYIFLKINSVNDFELNDKSDFLLIFPNPAQDYVKLVMNLEKGENIKLYIYDLTMQYKKLLHSNYYESGTYNLTFSTSDLQSGTYFIELQTNDTFTVKQLLVIR